MNAIGNWTRRLENIVSFSALTTLVLSVLWGVLTRYVTERPAVWTTELSGILFTWVVYIGAMTAFRDGHHIRVTLFLDILPQTAQHIMRRVGDLIVLAFLVYVTYLAFLMMQKGATRPSPVLDIPFSLVYLATVICFSGMTITAALRLVGVVAQPDAEQEEQAL